MYRQKRVEKKHRAVRQAEHDHKVAEIHEYNKNYLITKKGALFAVFLVNCSRLWASKKSSWIVYIVELQQWFATLKSFVLAKTINQTEFWIEF